MQGCDRSAPPAIGMAGAVHAESQAERRAKPPPYCISECCAVAGESMGTDNVELLDKRTAEVIIYGDGGDLIALLSRERDRWSARLFGVIALLSSFDAYSIGTMLGSPVLIADSNDKS